MIHKPGNLPSLSPVCRSGQPCRNGLSVLATIPATGRRLSRIPRHPQPAAHLCVKGLAVPHWQKYLFSLGLAVCSSALAAEGPSVMSLDFCADQYVLAFAEPEDIVAVSYEAADVNSFFASRAVGLPTTNGSLEEVLLNKPELVVRTWRGSMAGDAMAARLGTDTFQPAYAMSQADNLGNLISAAEVLGGSAKAAAMVADYEARWAALRSAPKSKLRAVYMTPSGFTAGEGTFVDDIIRLAGFETVAKDAGMRGWVPLPLEKMIMDPPDVVIGSFFNEGAVHISHWSGGRHGAYTRMIDDLPTIMVPSRYLSCSGAFFVDAAEYIRDEAAKLGLMQGQVRETAR